MSKKSALARKREAREAKRRRKLRLMAMGIAAAVVVVAGAVAAIVYFAVFWDSSPEAPLVKRDLTVGEGAEAEYGKLLTVHYTGWLEDGTEFDSSIGGEPFQFTLGQGQVIQGWDQGVLGMKVGGKRELIIPPDLAYGETGRGDIPPNATLTFDVELLAVE